MRILASNPDTLGDLILRQPLYAALRAAGHELMLLVRRGASAAAVYVAPGAGVVELPYEPYAHDVDAKWEAFEPAVRAAIDFAPDLLLVAPYQWTIFEERLAALMPAQVKKAGMSGHLVAGDPRAGAAPVSTLKLDIVAEVEADEPDVQKNAKLAAALGAQVVSVDPVIAPTATGLNAAQETLGRLALTSTANGLCFWIVCVTGTAHVSLKTWQAEKWAEFLSAWAACHPERKFLFTGLAAERPDAEAVIARLNADVAARCSVWAEEGGTFDELVGLISLAGGYIGHDTGPMHIAAALRKPVIGVFGGGTWPRFVPAVTPSVAVMVHVPCVGCGWSCSFETSHCIKAVPVDAVLQAAEDLDAGRVTGRERRELEPSRDLLVRMTREAAGTVQREVRVAAQAGIDLAATHQDLISAHRARQAEVDEAARAREEARQAREGRDAFEAAMRRHAEEADSARAEVERLNKELTLRTADVESSSGRLGTHLAALEHIGSDAVRFLETDPHLAQAIAPATAKEPEPIRLLRERIDRLKDRIRELTPAPKPAPPPPPPRPPRRALGQVIAEWFVGQRTYNARPPRPLPRVSIVTPSLNDAARLRRTIESVAAQDYLDLEFIVVDGGSTDVTPTMLEEFNGRINRLVVEADDGPLHAVSKGLELSQGDVLHLLFAGEVLEPGSVLRVAEYFSRETHAQAASFDDAVESPEGWRFVPPRQPLDVYALLGMRDRLRVGIWFRRYAYDRIGKVKPALGRAADWDLYVRLARRWGIRQAAGQVRRRDADRPTSDVYRRDWARAREAFQSSFGLPGRLRCGMIRAANRIASATLGEPGNWHFPFAAGARALPTVEPPAFVPGQPVSPLTNRHPDRLLFSTPDISGGDRGLSVVYYDSAAGMAVTYPPVSLERLTALYESRSRSGPQPPAPPAAGVASPFARYTGSRFARILSRLPSPYWWFARPRFDDTTADDFLAAMAGLRSWADSDVRILVVGCYEGQVLDVLKSRTKWQLAGTDTNEHAIAAARAKGHRVWKASPMDAASVIPVNESFDVIFLNGITEHLQDPLLVLRRLRQLLLPGGLVVINTPNLDSKLLTLYGPTWIHWQAPYHRTLMGRRAMRKLAELADLELASVHTSTHPYPVTASAQVNAFGLGGIVPEGATFPNEISSRGVRLTGWAKLLWDRRRKGDVMFAVMRVV
jgi:ADP-heptose:LPS heptosyltransferase/glycosyltransferase involved in cell wall biosynthesis/SAM-dependent methyltransferase